MAQTAMKGHPPAAAGADLILLRRADAAGKRLFRELAVSRIAWSAVSEASRLIAVDVVGIALRATGCEHPEPCRLHHCFDRLDMKAVLGNQGPRLPGLRLDAGAGVGGRVLESGRPVAVPEYGREDFDAELTDVVNEEQIRALVGVPVEFGGEVRGVLYAGLRGAAEFSPGAIEALGRLCTYAGAALAAAYDRARVEEVAALRERRRLSRSLHDELGQRIFGLGVTAGLARASAVAGGADLVTYLHRLEQEIGAMSAALRTTLNALHKPSTPSGQLAVRVREDVGAFTGRCGVPAHLLVIGDPVPVDETREDLLVRVGQEALRNVERHSDAHEVTLTLAFQEEAVELVVQDDGVGPRGSGSGGSLGLAMISDEVKRVGGGLTLRGNEESGATMRVRLPLPAR